MPYLLASLQLAMKKKSGVVGKTRGFVAPAGAHLAPTVSLANAQITNESYQIHSTLKVTAITAVMSFSIVRASLVAFASMSTRYRGTPLPISTAWVVVQVVERSSPVRGSRTSCFSDLTESSSISSASMPWALRKATVCSTAG